MGNRTNLYYRTPDNLTAYYSEWPPQRPGSLRPFSDVSLFTRNAILPLDKTIADCFFFRPRNLARKGAKPPKIPLLGLGLHPARSGRTQRHTGANTGRFGWSAITTLGLCCGLSNSPGAGVRTACFSVHALCPSPDGMNWMPSFSAFALAFCCAAARSAFSNCRS